MHTSGHLQVHKHTHIDTYVCPCARAHTNPSILHPSFSLLNLPDLCLSSFFILVLKHILIAQSLSFFFWQNSGIQKNIQSVTRSKNSHRTGASLTP